MIRRSIQGKILVFVIFLLGIATGVLATSVYQSRVMSARTNFDGHNDRGNPPAERVSMAKYLNLDDAQQEQIKKILDDTRAEVRKFRDDTEPQLKDIWDRSRAKIREVLNEEQRRKSDEFWQNRDKREKDRDRDRDRDRRPPRPDDRDHN